MKSLNYYFTSRLPFGLGHMVINAWKHIKKEDGLTDDEIERKLCHVDVESEFEHRSTSETILGAFSWSDSKEGHEFWEEIYNKLKQIEQR